VDVKAPPAATPALLEGWRDGGEGLLDIYCSKLRMWSCYLLAQWGVARTLSLEAVNTMQQEAVGIRNAHAWSVPCEAALELISAQSPLLELGAGNGLWARLLRERGADVLAFDTRRWSDAYARGGGGSARAGRAPPPAAANGDELMGARESIVREGGPQEAATHRERALVLMWPDYGGRGSYGLACLEAYKGDVLVLVGEWRDRTYGAYTEGLPETGQSFSKDFQTAVEKSFERVSEARLPNWPYFLDTVTIWRRRRRAFVLRMMPAPLGGEVQTYTH